MLEVDLLTWEVLLVPVLEVEVCLLCFHVVLKRINNHHYKYGNSVLYAF